MGQSTLALPSEVRVALSRARGDLRARGISTVVTSTFRTVREQTFLYNMFLRGQSSFPVAPPGRSRHQFGLAVDLVAVPPSGLPVVVEVMRSVGFQWAGASDTVHFDYVLPVVRPSNIAGDARMLSGALIARPSRKPIPKTEAVRPLSSCCCL